MHACESSVHSYQNDKTREDTKDSKVQHTMGADTFCNVSYRDVFSTIPHIFVRKGYVSFMFFSWVCVKNSHQFAINDIYKFFKMPFRYFPNSSPYRSS